MANNVYPYLLEGQAILLILVTDDEVIQGCAPGGIIGQRGQYLVQKNNRSTWIGVRDRMGTDNAGWWWHKRKHCQCWVSTCTVNKSADIHSVCAVTIAEVTITTMVNMVNPPPPAKKSLQPTQVSYLDVSGWEEAMLSNSGLHGTSSRLPCLRSSSTSPFLKVRSL